MDSKSQIRRAILDLRRAMLPEEVAERSAAIRRNLARFASFRAASTFLCYIASKDNEVDTRPLIEDLLARHSTVLVPIVEPGGVLTWSRLESLADVRPARFGILEPKPECVRPGPVPNEDAVALVPGIAFTREGYRIGYGGGYYDRFLASFKGTAVGLAFDLQIVPSFHHEPHDIPVAAVVTESAIHTGRARTVEPAP